MSRIRDIANVLSTATSLATDTETAAAISSHNSANDPHTGYVLESLYDAKGDLIVGSADNTPSKLTSGNNGETLVANSSTATGLSYQENYAAGKNKCINGAFDNWQRGTSFAGNVYTSDRWTTQTNKTLTVSQQTFTPGAAPQAGYEGTFFLRQTYSAGGSYGALQTKLEDVRLFAGQTITLSYWAKADATYSNTPSVNQNFGSGGSGGVTTNGTTHNITTSWTHYSSVIVVPSISGKTIGTSSFFMLQPILIESAGARTIDIWGVQVEDGSVATAFQTATGSIQGELAACQRYYFRATTVNPYLGFAVGANYSTTACQLLLTHPVAMRNGISVDYSNLALVNSVGAVVAFTTISYLGFGPMGSFLNITGSSGLSAGNSNILISNNSSSGYIAINGEL